MKWQSAQCRGNTATCRVHEQTAAAAATTNGEEGSSISQQVLGVKKTCRVWNIDVTSRPLARGCCADATQWGASLFFELSTGSKSVSANHRTERWLRHDPTQNHENNNRTSDWFLCVLPEQNLECYTALLRLLHNGAMQPFLFSINIVFWNLLYKSSVCAETFLPFISVLYRCLVVPRPPCQPKFDAWRGFSLFSFFFSLTTWEVE